jgi:hypothetical protein
VRIYGRICALALSAAILGGVVGVNPASADTPEAFAGTATARALNLSLLGIKVTAGQTTALADSSPKAQAAGAGLALITQTVSQAAVNGPNASQAPPKACGVDLPIANLLTVALACSQSSASTNNASPTAISGANIAAIDVGVLDLVLDLLDPILDALVPVVDQVIGDVTGTLQPLLGGLLDPLLQGLQLDLQSPVQSLVDALRDVTNLAEIRVGDSASQVVTEGTKVTATAAARGAEIRVLPGLTAAGGPLLSITVGSATATSIFDRVAGTSTASFDPAILTLNVLGTSIPVGLGQPLTLFPGTALESTISLGAGRTVQNPDGTVGAVADGVSLQLLKGLSGGIVLELAHAESAVGGAKAVITPQSLPSPQAERKAPELARTGGMDVPLLPVGFVLVLLAVLTRRFVRASR